MPAYPLLTQTRSPGACPLPPPSIAARLQGPKVVLGPGTGLGEAVLFWDDHIQNYKVHPSGGCCGLAERRRSRRSPSFRCVCSQSAGGLKIGAPNTFS